MPPARPPRPARALGAAATTFAVVSLAGAAFAAWREAERQGWTEHGLGWLALERFALARAHLPALAAAALVLLFAATAARTRAGSRLWRAARAEVAGHPVCMLPALALALLLPGVVVHGTRPAPARRAPNVVVVSLTGWRADRAGFLGYARPVTPALDLVARRGVVLARASAPSTGALPSVATLLTGLSPERHGAAGPGARLDPERTTLLEVLHGHGWQTAAFSGDPDVSSASGFAQGVEHFRDYVHEPCHADDCGRADEVIADVETWIATERDPARPFCAALHLADALAPHAAPGGYRGMFDRPRPHGGERDPSVDRYDEELLALDQVLGPFLERLLRSEPNTVVVLTGVAGADLGDADGEEERLHAPVVLLARTLDPSRATTRVRLMDLAPTLLELVGLGDALPGAEGESLLPVLAGLETEDRP